MSKLNAYQLYSPKHYAGRVNDVYFASFYGKYPQKASNVVRQILNRNVETYAGYLSQFTTLKIEDHNEEFMWEMIGSSERNIPLLWAKVGASLVTSATEGVGSLGSRFTLAFPEKWFAEGEIVVGELNELYRIKLISDGIPSGSVFVYTAELTGDNHTYGMPGSELIAGKRFSFEYSAPIEHEGHDDQGTLRFGGSLGMKQEITKIRKSYTVYGRELNRKLHTPIRFKSGNEVKEFTMSMPMVEWEFNKEMEEEFSRLLVYGRSNRDEYGNYHDRGKSGHIIKMGAGLREQKQVGNVFIYDTFSLNYLEEAMYQLSAGRFDMKDRIFTMRTGERGAVLFHNAIAEKLNSWSPIGGRYQGDNNVPVTSKVSSPLHSNSIAVGMQFTEYRAPNGAIFKVIVDPMYDDTFRNKIMKGGSEKNGPAESYRFDIDYIGPKDAVPNIQLVQVKGWEGGKFATHGGPMGFGNPWGGAGHGANGIDEYTATKVMTGGVAVYDPTKCVTILPQELAPLA